MRCGVCALLLTAAVALTAVTASSCGKRGNANIETQHGTAGATSVIINPEVVYRDRGGTVLWSARARRSIAQQATSAVELEGVSATIYDDGRPSWTCKAGRLKADEPSSRVTFLGDVLITSADDRARFRAPRVVWAVKEARMYGDGGVRLQVGKLVVQGRRFEVNTIDGTWRVIGASSATFAP